MTDSSFHTVSGALSVARGNEDLTQLLKDAEDRADQRLRAAEERAEDRVDKLLKAAEERRVSDLRVADDRVDKLLKAAEERRISDLKVAEERRISDLKVTEERVREAGERADRHLILYLGIIYVLSQLLLLLKLFFQIR
jgi:vacuolar-type H+-ATPase subunit H